MERLCSNCKFMKRGGDNRLLCGWEHAALPPPFWRGLRWGVRTPDTQDETAQRCNQFEAQGTGAPLL